MNNSRIKLLKNIYFRGDLNGKYEAKIISNANNDSKISLIETTISEAGVCSELDFFNHNYNNLEYAKVEDVTINLANNKDLKDYRFVEDITNLKIGDISLSKQMKDGSVTFGVIQGRAMFTLIKEDEVLINFYRKPKEDLEIIFPDVEKKKRKQRLLKLIKSFILILLGICLVCFLVFLLSNIDFDAKKKQFFKFKDKVETRLTSKTIRLTNSGGQNYAPLTIDGIKQKFLLDTGASMSTVPLDFIDQLIKKGYITPEIHFIKHKQFRIADGNIIKGGIWRIPKIKIGSETVYNVEFSSVSSKNAPFLLGMSTLERLGNYSIVPNENKIIINK